MTIKKETKQTKKGNNKKYGGKTLKTMEPQKVYSGQAKTTIELIVTFLIMSYK